MNRYLIQLLCGTTFGAGLAVAGMTDPRNVLAFLDLFGAWNPALMFVLGSAVTFTAAAYYLIQKRSQPLLAGSFELSEQRTIDRKLVLGAAIFGVGWGLSGYCPGPAITLLGHPSNPEAWPFLSGMLVGTALPWLGARLTQR